MTAINKVYEYGKTLLTSDGRQVYDQLADGILNLQSTITINTGLDPVSMKTICRYYLNDHVEDFFIDNNNPINIVYYYYLSGSAPVYVKYVITPVYTYNVNAILSMRQSMNTAAEQIIDTAKNSADIEKTLHDAMIEECQYDITYQDINHTAYGGFVNKTAVCDGYAKAIKLLLDSQGIKTVFVTGTATNGITNEGHAWDLVQTVDEQTPDEWLYLDVTFDDPVSVINGNYYTGNTTPYYNYFNKASFPDHTLGTFDSANPFAQDSENYAAMPSVG